VLVYDIERTKGKTSLIHTYLLLESRKRGNELKELFFLFKGLRDKILNLKELRERSISV